MPKVRVFAEYDWKKFKKDTWGVAKIRFKIGERISWWKSARLFVIVIDPEGNCVQACSRPGPHRAGALVQRIATLADRRNGG